MRLSRTNTAIMCILTIIIESTRILLLNQIWKNNSPLFQMAWIVILAVLLISMYAGKVWSQKLCMLLYFIGGVVGICGVIVHMLPLLVMPQMFIKALVTYQRLLKEMMIRICVFTMLAGAYLSFGILLAKVNGYKGLYRRNQREEVE
jgi:hypothetical protein